MNPLQEYYLRNNVRAPYVFFGSSQVILHNPQRIRSSDRYRLFDIRAVNKEGNDGVNIGKFDMSFATPDKTGGSYFTKDDEWFVYWHEYEQHILDKIKEWRNSDWYPLGDSDELKMACWELLSYTRDSRFAELPLSLLDLNYKILDCNLSFGTRVGLLNSIVEWLTSCADVSCNSVYKSIVSTWCELVNMINSPRYAHWLVRLSKG